MKKINYKQYNDEGILSILDPGDTFQQIRIGDKIETHTITLKPVWFTKSQTWTVRVPLLGKVGLDNPDNFRYIHIHKSTMHLFKFNENHIRYYKNKKALNKLNPIR